MLIIVDVWLYIFFRHHTYQHILCHLVYADKVKSGLIKPVKLVFAQPETYVLYKEMMLMKGNSIAQLKPVTVIGNELQRKFFFGLVEDFEEIKRLSAKK